MQFNLSAEKIFEYMVYFLFIKNECNTYKSELMAGVIGNL